MGQETAPIELLADRVLAGEVAALARACRIVDERAAGFRELLTRLHQAGRSARRIGITGAPGVGKSTFTDALIVALRERGERVAVIAVDPSSPFSGGALLGDRIRMQRHALDPNVFIRSLASRGASGGLSRSATDVMRVAEAWGAHTVLLETVGVGQAELALLGVVESSVVVVMPGAGDDVQANKAGILELADVLVLNKADKPGADAAEAELRVSLGLSRPQAFPTSHGHVALSGAPATTPRGWQVPVLRTQATSAEGVPAVLAALDAHARWFTDSPDGRDSHAERERRAIRHFLEEAVLDVWRDELASRVHAFVDAVQRRELEPYSAVDAILAAP